MNYVRKFRCKSSFISDMIVAIHLEQKDEGPQSGHTFRVILWIVALVIIIAFSQ